MYMIHLYCFAVQAGFYSDVVDVGLSHRWPGVRSPATALVTGIFLPVTILN